MKESTKTNLLFFLTAFPGLILMLLVFSAAPSVYTFIGISGAGFGYMLSWQSFFIDKVRPLRVRSQIVLAGGLIFPLMGFLSDEVSIEVLSVYYLCLVISGLIALHVMDLLRYLFYSTEHYENPSLSFEEEELATR